MRTQTMRLNSPDRFAVILGTNEIASAVAVLLRRNGYGVVLSHDPLPPVIRRKMAFHDALFEDAVSVAGVAAQRADTGFEIRASFGRAPGVLVTELGLLDLIVLRSLDILVDARMQKYLATPDLRRLARLTIGLGPGFCGGSNCDVAIETWPGKAGQIVRQGPADPPDGVSRRLGNHWGERFVRSECSGRWKTAIEIGTRVFKDYVVGHLGNIPVRAPFDGILRGVVRDGTEVPSGVKLLEIDSRGRKANWTGIDSRGQLIANAVAKAISLHQPNVPEKTGQTLHLVK
ncbi:xanthine dehydrogenase [Bradyrhizobium sediminis]|uniref:Xanthine dehydrogenase n=2 Tax=Bradyrhizobium sediminis TaxID=2840469 RepID=A0A975NID6_9BRAD|nr:xanthine dehydrogenase [Bradyrhizobium sediminis]QWG15713.1 xanthine dehydrogenase [Bradyrhizobium sediminis]